MKLWNGTAVKSSTGGTVPNSGQNELYVGVCSVVTLSGSETWKVSAASNQNGVIIAATPVINNGGCANTASHLIAIKLA